MPYKIQNTDTIQEIRQVARLSISEGFPERLAEAVVPVVNVNPKDHRIADIVRSNTDTATGSLTIYTTPSDKDFYLNSITLSSQDNATADNVLTSVTATIDGASRTLLAHAKLTTTATSKDSMISFQKPIKIDRGTAIAVSNSFTVGGATKFASISGWEVGD